MFVLFYFALTMFTSATLLFIVQPMIGKMILPRLGGTPAVWTTCMVFFQAVLLFGYGYTHLVSTMLPKRRQMILHALLLLMPFTVLPFSLGSWTPPEDSNPIFSLLGILSIVVGVPFFLVSTSAPLLQKWFAYTGHPSSQDPYFLYGASNLGSMLALALYPLAMEPNFFLEVQALIWTWGYALCVLLILGCIAIVWTKADSVPQTATEPLPMQPAVPVETAITPASRTRRSRIATPALETPNVMLRKADDITWWRRLRWIALAAVPSSLMLGCTTYMTTDIAAIPFFWVLPLALYLMTFIFVFARWPVVWTGPNSGPPTPLRTQWGMMILGAAGVLVMGGVFMHLVIDEYANPFEAGWPHVLYLIAFFLFFIFWNVNCLGGPHDFVLYFQPCFLLFLVLKLVAHIGTPTWLEFTLHLFSFFFITLMCHGELASDRPTSKHLTEFYLWMSVGGVLGGIFNALFAPMLFKFGVLEYPLAMIVACFLRPNLTTESTLFPGDSSKRQPTLLGYALDIFIPLVLLGLAFGAYKLGDKYGYRSILIAAPIVGVLALAMRPLRFGLALMLVWGMFAKKEADTYDYVHQDRGFFGLIKVRLNKEGDKTYHTLIHGGIDHGRQHVEPNLRHEPCAYFHPVTGIGQVFMKLTWPNTPLPDSIEDFDTRPNPYHSFTLPSWRFPAGLIGVGNDPLAALAALHSEPPFAVVGLGTGTLAAFAKPYQSVDMYEIDPLVLRLSQKVDGKEPPFTYLLDAEARGANLKVILGDGRLKIEKAPELWYHIICLDAFSSDAIPVHLLTVDAIEIYLKKLAPGGVLVFNATNRYVEIAGVLKDAADHLGLECWYLSDWYRDLIPEKYGTDFVMMRRSPATIAKLGKTFNGGPSLPDRLDRDNWVKLLRSMEIEYKKRPEYGSNYQMSWRPWKEPDNLGGQLWTDRYSNLLSVLRLGP